MSVSVSRESISTLMTELADSFPMEADGRSSISDFGKLLFAEGNSGGASGTAAAAASDGGVHVKQEASNGANDGNASAINDDDNDDNDDADDDDDDEDDDGAVDDEMTPAVGGGASGGATGGSASDGAGSDKGGNGGAGTKRVFTEIKGVPRQKHHDVQCVVTDSGKIAISHGSMNKLLKAKDKAVPKRWTPEEDERLRQAVAKHGERNWKSIAEEVPGRNHTQCLQRWTKVLAPGLVKGHWRPDEDELLKELVAEGRKNWGQVANRIPGRTSKQCRERWYNHLDPSIVRGEYTAEEDRIVLEAQARLGNKWSTIAAMLPGRTEDAVKIRWKSLCRVRKGQNRRSGGSASGNGSASGTPSAAGGNGNDKAAGAKPKTPGGGSGGGGFNGHLVKSEELRAFGGGGAAIPTQATPMGRVPMMQPMMGHPQAAMTTALGPGGVPTMLAYAPPGAAAAYATSAAAGMAGYPKTVMMTPVNSYGQPVGAPVLAAVPAGQDYSLDRRANVVNISNGGAGPPGSAGGYRPVYATTATAYSVDANGNMYATAGVPAAYVTSANGAVYRVPSPTPVVAATPMHGSMMASYGYPVAAAGTPSAAESQMYAAQYAQGVHPGDQYAAAAQYNHQQAAMQQQHQQQHQQQQQQASPARSHQQYQQQEGQATNDQAETATAGGKQQATSSSSSSASKPTAPRLAAAFAQSLSKGATPKAATANPASMFASKLSGSNNGAAASPASAFAQKAAASSSSSSKLPAPVNPAAMFAQNLASKVSTPSAAVAGAKRSPVAAFLQKQQNAENNASTNGTAKSAARPFNPAIAFAQRLQKPPMMPPSSAATSTSSVKSTDDDADGMSEDGGDEPSQKKVRPRNSIDMAARASAARRMRTSGSGSTLMGRRSLDVFLNEIGDVGRISDLKMDEFQTMDELWRVSGDMDRLSL